MTLFSLHCSTLLSRKLDNINMNENISVVNEFGYILWKRMTIRVNLVSYSYRVVDSIVLFSRCNGGASVYEVNKLVENPLRRSNLIY